MYANNAKSRYKERRYYNIKKLTMSTVNHVIYDIKIGVSIFFLEPNVNEENQQKLFFKMQYS